MPFDDDDLIRHARISGIIPVIVLDDPAHAVPLATALRDGGLQIIEVTLRTPAALAAIRTVRAALPELTIGAGTVTRPEEAAAAREAGAQFAVSPGYTVELGAACRELQLPLLPGVATATEVMVARNDGLRFLKFFPASTSGGIAMLDALRGPFPDVSFCPTGGIDASSVASYLALPNVACVGGSWMAPRALIQAQDWPALTALVSQVAGSRPAPG